MKHQPVLDTINKNVTKLLELCGKFQVSHDRTTVGG